MASMFKTAVQTSRASSFISRRSYSSGSTVNVGIIGAGRIGRVHAQTLAGVAGAKLAWITDVFPEGAKKAAEDFKVPAWSQNYKDILNDPQIHAIWICSPSDTHAPIIKEAALAGKQIFCEKPVATDLKGTEEALEVVAKTGVKMFLAFQRRFDPNFMRVKKAIVSGEIGDPVSVRLTSRDPAPPPVDYVKQSGGIFKDMAIHDLDMSRFLMGCEPVEIFAQGLNRVDPKIKDLEGPLAYDTALTLVKYENGAVVTIDNCRKAVYGYDQRAEVFGTKGCVVSENNYPSNVHVWGDTKVSRDLPLNFFMERYADAYKNETVAFVENIQKGTPIVSTGNDGRVALIMAMAAAKSAAENRIVKISEIKSY